MTRQLDTGDIPLLDKFSEFFTLRSAWPRVEKVIELAEWDTLSETPPPPTHTHILSPLLNKIEIMEKRKSVSLSFTCSWQALHAGPRSFWKTQAHTSSPWPSLVLSSVTLVGHCDLFLTPQGTMSVQLDPMSPPAQSLTGLSS